MGKFFSNIALPLLPNNKSWAWGAVKNAAVWVIIL